MEEILVGGIVGGIVVALSSRFEFFKKATKAVIKTGYSVSAAVAAGGGETIESLKDLVAESKVEFEAEKAAKAQAAVDQTKPN